LHFQNFSSEPPVDVYLHELHLETTNLSNAKGIKDTLPSHLTDLPAKNHQKSQPIVMALGHRSSFCSKMCG
jgi:hypothetical protein